MRFAWLRDQTVVKLGCLSTLTFAAYNVIYWVPLILPVFKIIEPKTGFVWFSVILIVRASVNVIRNNVLTVEQAQRFPFRAS
jgi:hypothetical protein